MTEPERVPEPDIDAPDGAPDGVPREVEDAAEPRTDRATADDPGPGLPPPTGVESLVGALLEAGPEVAEHVVRAAQELLLAAQAIVDAADRAVQEQQRIHAEAAAARDAGNADPGVEGDSDTGADAPAPVRHLDIAE